MAILKPTVSVESNRHFSMNMEAGKILPFLCLVLLCVFHLTNGQCKELSEEELTSCRSEGLCYECSVGCECGMGFAKSNEGFCIPQSMCAETPSKEGVRVARATGCNNCERYCERFLKIGRCIQNRCVCQ